MDMQGNVLQTIGSNGEGQGEFNYPTELRLHGQNLVVVDAMNFRVQVLDRSGKFQYAIGQTGRRVRRHVPAQGHRLRFGRRSYVVDGLWGVVQVFNRQGQLLYSFGNAAPRAGEFQLPAGLFIDRDDRIFVVDSFNRRIQVFHYYGLPKPARRLPVRRGLLLLAALLMLMRQPFAGSD